MKFKKIEASAQAVSRWSGGTTTQLAICPPEAVYADRDFLWRISSAVVELPESEFTPLPDYDRILMILDGELSLSHNGGEEYKLCSLDQTSFDGGAHTFSRGRVTDFNLMMRKGKCSGRVEARKLAEGENWCDALSADCDSHLLYCVAGGAAVEADGRVVHLVKGDAVLMENDCGAICCDVCGDAVLVLAETKTV